MTAIEEKIRRLPENYVLLVSDYVDALLEKAEKINALKGSLSKYADSKLREKEKEAWANAAAEKHSNEKIA